MWFFNTECFFYQYNIFDLGLTNSNYLIAGAIFIFYLATYIVFGGRSILLVKKWLQQNIDILKTSRFPIIGSFIAFIHSLIEVVLYHCMSAATFVLFAYPNNSVAGFYTILILSFIILYPLDVLNIDKKYPLLFIIIEIIIKAIAISSFFRLSTNLQPIMIFALFAAFSLYINLVLDQFERYKPTTERIFYTCLYSFIFFLSSAVAFGAFVYGDISKKIGGGESTSIEFALDPKNTEKLVEKDENTMSGKILYMSSENIYFLDQNKTIILPRSSILWMKFPEKKDNTLLNFLQEFFHKHS